MTDATCGFQRARRPEQREARRQAILDAAAAMLAEAHVTEISLRELSRRVGLAKSNVLRYFESREAVFLELLDRAARDWLADLEPQLSSSTKETRRQAIERVGATLAESLTQRPLLCELISVIASVLERNISVDVARQFKLSTMESIAILAGLVRKRIPGLDDAGAQHFATAALVIVGGLWPFANPTEQVQVAIEQLNLDVPHLAFPDMLREALTTHLAGVVARST